MATFADISTSLVNQLRLLDPSISAEIGTPERMIIDAVAQAISDSELDLTLLQGTLDFESKFGINLDNFLSLFGFARQQASFATGFATFSTLIPNTTDVTLPVTTQIIAPSQPTSDSSTSTVTANVIFSTTAVGILPAGETSVVVPIQANIAGTAGNVPAGAITSFVNTPIIGVTQVTNPIATQGGVDAESDDQFKVRFKNTVFRNVAGTPDMYAALAAALVFTTKANVIGSINRYRDYFQVPVVDDASTDPETGLIGNGIAGEWTTGLSNVPFSKHVWDNVPTYLSNEQTSSLAAFYRDGVDYRMNTDQVLRNRGDTYRNAISGADISPSDPTAKYSPNVSLLNVYSGTDPAVEAPRPGDLLLFEHSYLSQASRNDFSRRVLNAVDVFIDGVNSVTTSTVLPLPRAGENLIVDDPASPYHWQNYRRFGQPEHRPILGNIFQPMYWQPAIALPAKVTVGQNIYYLDQHYWLLEDWTETRGTVRARNGIEWNVDLNGQGPTDLSAEPPYTGPKIFANPETSIDINNYAFNKNVSDLQANLDASKQVATDVLAHTAKTRFFKLDVVIQYSTGGNISSVNSAIGQALQIFLSTQDFGSVIQMSDLLNVIHNVVGVGSVRWNRDDNSAAIQVTECDINGNPLLNLVIDRVTTGNSTLHIAEVQQFYLTGSPEAGTYTLTLHTNTTLPIAYNATAAQVKAAFGLAGISAETVVGSGTPEDPFLVTFGATPLDLMSGIPDMTSTVTQFNDDFFLTDDELANLPVGQLGTDTVSGVIIHERVQNTWKRR